MLLSIDKFIIMGDMSRNDVTSAAIDALLRMAAGGTFLTTALVLPNSAVALEKPLSALLKRLDKRQSERELQRLFYYMKRNGVVAFKTDDYEHGLKITPKGRRRLKRVGFEKLAIAKPNKWDHKWRLIFFDIPERHRDARRALTYKLRQLGCVQLQRSIWVHPFPCRPEIETVAETIKVSKYLSYVEATGLDSEEQLINRFPKLLHKKGK